MCICLHVVTCLPAHTLLFGKLLSWSHSKCCWRLLSQRWCVVYTAGSQEIKDQSKSFWNARNKEVNMMLGFSLQAITHSHRKRFFSFLYLVVFVDYYHFNFLSIYYWHRSHDMENLEVLEKCFGVRTRVRHLKTPDLNHLPSLPAQKTKTKKHSRIVLGNLDLILSEIWT